jgi:hypothetical protein
LAPEPGVDLQPPGLIELIVFVVGCFVAAFHSSADVHVARRAGANAAAGMIQIDVSAFGDIENAERQAVMAGPTAGRIDLNDDVQR